MTQTKINKNTSVTRAQRSLTLKLYIKSSPLKMSQRRRRPNKIKIRSLQTHTPMLKWKKIVLNRKNLNKKKQTPKLKIMQCNQVQSRQ